jgi:hypothetical protein
MSIALFRNHHLHEYCASLNKVFLGLLLITSPLFAMEKTAPTIQLRHAIKEGNLIQCQRLIAQEASMYYNVDGMNALQEAVLYGKSTALVEWLMEQWPELLNAKIEYNCTLLHYAVLGEQAEMVYYITFLRPFSLKSIDDFGRKPHTIALISKNLTLAMWLAEEEAFYFPSSDSSASIVESQGKKRAAEEDPEDERSAKNQRTD